MRILFLFLLLAWSGAAAASVEVAFYSKEFGSQFPHGFVVVTGTVDATGEKVDTNYGFTARTVSPAILLGSVGGKVEAVSAGYVRSSRRHFSMVLSDEEYRNMLRVVDKWRTLDQPSYNLNRRNCVHFLGEMAAALGLRAAPIQGLMKKPTSFLNRVAQDNQALIAARAPRAPARTGGAQN